MPVRLSTTAGIVDAKWLALGVRPVRSTSDGPDANPARRTRRATGGPSSAQVSTGSTGFPPCLVLMATQARGAEPSGWARPAALRPTTERRTAGGRTTTLPPIRPPPCVARLVGDASASFATATHPRAGRLLVNARAEAPQPRGVFRPPPPSWRSRPSGGRAGRREGERSPGRQVPSPLGVAPKTACRVRANAVVASTARRSASTASGANWLPAPRSSSARTASGSSAGR